jgi:hypothetical protein
VKEDLHTVFKVSGGLVYGWRLASRKAEVEKRKGQAWYTNPLLAWSVIFK